MIWFLIIIGIIFGLFLYGGAASKEALLKRGLCPCQHCKEWMPLNFFRIAIHKETKKAKIICHKCALTRQDEELRDYNIYQSNDDIPIDMLTEYWLN